MTCIYTEVRLQSWSIQPARDIRLGLPAAIVQAYFMDVDSDGDYIVRPVEDISSRRRYPRLLFKVLQWQYNVVVEERLVRGFTPQQALQALTRRYVDFPGEPASLALYSTGRLCPAFNLLPDDYQDR